jgi:hypothetical protein
MKKLCFEYALESYERAYGLRFVALRYFGPEVNPDAPAIAETAKSAPQAGGKAGLLGPDPVSITLHLNGKDVPAKKGDVVYAAPWDFHGLTNTGSTPLTFFVVKWGSKGLKAPEKPASK